MPPYMFAELERQIADKRAAGIDVISLGIGDPDKPTYPHVVEAMQEAVAEHGNQKYPSNRGREEFREAFADFYDRRFGVEIDPETEVIPAIGAKECIYNLCFAFLDPGDVALASDPGYPVYTGGPILAGAEPELLPLVPELGFAPDLDAIAGRRRRQGAADVPQLPEQPDRRGRPRGLLREGRRASPASTRSSSSTTTPTRRRPTTATSRRASWPRPGAKEVGVEVFSLSKGFNMTGWRCAAILGNAEAIQTYWRLKTNVDSGLFEAVQLAGAAALRGPQRPARAR